MVDRLLGRQDWFNIIFFPLFNSRERPRICSTLQAMRNATLFECDFYVLQVHIVISCKSGSSQRRQWQPCSRRKTYSHFVTTFDLSQSSICYLSKLANCLRRESTTKLGKKSPKTLILAWENGIVSPFTNISPIIDKRKQGCMGSRCALIYENAKRWVFWWPKCNLSLVGI